ncbi:MAG: hypothetical protein IKY21_03530 [Clostridia bacterium]|jgi:hypothetical protein|nr:hypothetical protein [Clostridia bacterium]
MSPKELLYVEDALSHTQQIKTVCTDFSNQVGDTELSNFISQIAQKQQKVFDNIYKLL